MIKRLTALMLVLSCNCATRTNPDYHEDAGTDAAIESDAGIDASIDALELDAQYALPPAGTLFPEWGEPLPPCIPPRSGVYGENIESADNFADFGNAYAAVDNAYRIDRTSQHGAVQCEQTTYIQPETCLTYCCAGPWTGGIYDPPILRATVDGWDVLKAGYCNDVKVNVMARMREQ